MERSSKSLVYIRRGESEKHSNSREALDGRDSKGDKGRSGHRVEGMSIRKRDAKDPRPTGKDEARKFNKDGQDRDDSSGRDSGGGTGSEKRMERSWKEIAEREEGRNRVLKVKGKEGNDESFRERKDIERGKGKLGNDKLGNDKGAKAVETRSPSKLKVKAGGVVRTLRSDTTAKTKHDLSSADLEMKSIEGRTGKAPEPVKKRRHRLILQDNSDDDDYGPPPVPIRKDITPTPSPIAKSADAPKGIDEDASARSSGQPFPTASRSRTVRKSSRIPKKKILEDFEDDVPAEGTRSGGGDGESHVDARSENGPDDEGDMDYDKEAGPSDNDISVSDDGSEDLDEDLGAPKAKRYRPQNGSKTQDIFAYPGKRRNAPLTARQRTMQLGKDGDAADVGPSLIEFPTGLTHSTRRGRAKLTEEERQVKKTEAATRRKQLVENAAKEIQATAIQKILGQDSSRKRKEERLQKQRKEIEQEREAAAREPASNSVRWSMGPYGTTVSWSQDVGLPEIFCTGPSKYPPAREKCAAPMCTNSFKYRDSKSSLPLCSLNCYRVVQLTPA